MLSHSVLFCCLIVVAFSQTNCDKYQNRSSCVTASLNSSSEDTSCLWCESDEISICIDSDLQWDLNFTLTLFDSNYTCYNTTKDNDKDDKKKSLVRQILSDFATDKSNGLKLFLDVLIIPPGGLISTYIFYAGVVLSVCMLPCLLYYILCFFICCFKNEQYYEGALGWFDHIEEYGHYLLYLGAITGGIFLIPVLPLMGIGLIIAKLCKVSLILYLNVTKIQGKHNDTCRSETFDMIVQYFGFVFSAWAFCSIGFYFAFSFDFVSVMHGGIPFFSILRSIWYGISAFLFCVIAALSLLGATLFLMYMVCYRLPGFGDKIEGKEAWIMLWSCVGIEIIMLVLVFLVFDLGFEGFLDVIYLASSVYGAIFIYIVFPEICYDFWILHKNGGSLSDDDMPPFFMHVYMILAVLAEMGDD